MTAGDGNVTSLPAGTEYVVESTPPSTDEEALANADGTPPRKIAENYTSTPADTPTRIGELADSITREAGASTPYEKSTAIADWLAENKQYSANASYTDSSHVVDDFLFENDTGSSEQFTAASASMLREEGVPARYVSGYSSGKNTGEGTYNVSARDRKAWTEVYIDGEGWVPVNPTPRTSRGSQDSSQSGDHEQESDQQTQEPEEEETDGEDVPLPPYNISVEPAPSPGQNSTVTVKKNDTAVVGAAVQFNGDPVGITDQQGTVEATVPYTESLTVTVNAPTIGSQLQPSIAGAGPITVPDSAFGQVPSPQFTLAQAGNETNNGSSRTYDLPTDITVDAGGYVLPGDSPSATFTINGSTVEGATVYIDDEQVGLTDETGRATLPIPTDAQPGENLTVRLEKGDIMSTTDVVVANLTADLNPSLIAHPGLGATVTVTATVGDEELPLENTTVALFKNGDGSGTPYTRVSTGANGTATISLPWSNSVTASATESAASTITTLSGLYLRTGAIGGLLITVVAGIAILGKRRGYTAQSIKDSIIRLLFTIADYLTAAGAWLTRTVRHVVASIRAGITVAKLQAAALWVVSIPIAAGKRLYVALRGLIFALIGVLRRDADAGEETGVQNPSHSQDAESERASAYRRLRRAWRWVVRYAFRRASASTKTAVEVGESAKAKGLPAGPVTRLRKAFQDVEYGPVDADQRVDAAESAVTELQAERDQQEDA